MNVVSLVILLENVACASVLEVWVVEGVEALLLDAVGARVMIDMGAGVIVRVGDLPDAVVYHQFEVVETLLHIAMRVVDLLMPMGTES